MPRAQVKEEKTYRSLRKKGERKKRQRGSPTHPPRAHAVPPPPREARADRIATGVSRICWSKPRRSGSRAVPPWIRSNWSTHCATT